MFQLGSFLYRCTKAKWRKKWLWQVLILSLHIVYIQKFFLNFYYTNTSNFTRPFSLILLNTYTHSCSQTQTQKFGITASILFLHKSFGLYQQRYKIDSQTKEMYGRCITKDPGLLMFRWYILKSHLPCPIWHQSLLQWWWSIPDFLCYVFFKMYIPTLLTFHSNHNSVFNLDPHIHAIITVSTLILNVI